MANHDIDIEMTEAILGIPFVFEADGHEYRIYPETLGKMLRLKPYLEDLNINPSKHLHAEVVQAVLNNPMAAARVIAIHTSNNPEEIKDRRRIEARAKKLIKRVEGEDLCALLVHCLSMSAQVDRFIEGTKIKEDRERRRQVLEYKTTRNTWYFGGRTLYGQLIDIACQRYGWTLDYVLWGISYTNLQMLLTDQYSTLFLTDEEAKGCHVTTEDSEVIWADDPNNREQLMRMFNDK